MKNFESGLNMEVKEYSEIEGTVELGDLAEGAIEGDYNNPEVVSAVEELISGEFHTEAGSEFPVQCIDGRSGAEIDPDTAGGSLLTAVVANNLVNDRFESADKSTKGAVLNAKEYFENNEIPIGGHTDDHAHGEASGCGANDKLPLIYQKIAEAGEQLRGIAEGVLGYGISDEMFNKIIEQAEKEREYSSGSEVLEAIKSGKDSKVAELKGDHNEAVVIINKQEGTTLDRQKLAEKYGNGIQAFNVDIWAIENLSKKIAKDPSDEAGVQALTTAAVYYNLATGLVLCSPQMKLAVLE